MMGWTRVLLGLALVGLTTTMIADPALPRTNAQDLERRIQRLKGKVVIVNLWATWCDPCREEMPDMVRLYNKYRKQGLEILAVSMDDPEEADRVVPPVVRQYRVNFPVLILYQDPNQFADRFDRPWRGEIPRTYIYSKSGKRLKAWSGKRSLQEFEREVKEAMRQK